MVTTDQQATELKATQQLLQATLDSSLDMIQVFEAVRNQQGEIIDFTWILNNQTAEKIYGNVVGKSLLQLQPGVVEEGIFEAFKQVVETGVPQHYEKHYVHEQFDGWFHQSVVKLNDGVATTTANITERKKAEEQLKQSQVFLQSVIDSSLDIIQVFKAVRDEAGAIVDFTWVMNNQQAIGQNGQVIGKRLLPQSPGVREAGLFDKFVQVTETGVSITHEQYYSHEQFHQQWFDQTLVKMGDGFMMTTKDITDRKKAELEILRLKDQIAQRAEEKYQAIFNSINEGFSLLDIQFDQQGKAYDVIIRDANPAQQRIDGLQALIGQRVREMLPDIELKWIERYAVIAQSGEPEHFEDWSQANQRWYRVSASRVGAAGSTLVALVYDDITERKQIEEALRAADQRKDEFLAMLAHELRNPLAPIRNGLQLLTQTHPQDQNMATLLPIMNRQMDHLVRLVDDLLDVSRISRGKVELRKERIELTQVVGQAVEAIQPLYTRSGRQLSTQLPDYPLYLAGDATRLNQVVTNLLTNGLRYTHEAGQVWLTLEQLDEQALLRVMDNGIGLTTDQLKTIFELFVQVDKSWNRSHGGLGLGLSLVQELVQGHGGRVEAHSRGLGQGSEFVVYLPILIA